MRLCSVAKRLHATASRMRKGEEAERFIKAQFYSTSGTMQYKAVETRKITNAQISYLFNRMMNIYAGKIPHGFQGTRKRNAYTQRTIH